jgi:hypothetical protein
MTRAQALQLLEQLKTKVGETDCGAILIIAASVGGLTDIDVETNLTRDDQERVYLMLLNKLRGGQ